MDSSVCSNCGRRLVYAYHFYPDHGNWGWTKPLKLDEEGNAIIDEQGYAVADEQEAR